MRIPFSQFVEIVTNQVFKESDNKFNGDEFQNNFWQNIFVHDEISSNLTSLGGGFS